MTSNEQHFKRDAWLSQRHRTWGYDLPALDIDFLMVEFNHKVPRLLIDYKNEHATIDLNGIGAQVLTNLGDMAGLPAFFVVYGHSQQTGWWGNVPEESRPWFQIIPLNMYAHAVDSPSFDNNTKLTELQFVSWLYAMRGLTIPDHIITSIPS